MFENFDEVKEHKHNNFVNFLLTDLFSGARLEFGSVRDDGKGDPRGAAVLHRDRVAQGVESWRASEPVSKSGRGFETHSLPTWTEAG